MSAFIDALLPRVAHASLQSIVLAALVYALCRGMPSLSAATRSWLWWLVAAQMVLGVTCPDLFTLRLLPAPTTVHAVVIQNTGTDMPSIDVANDTTPSTLSWQTLLLSAWAIAIVVQVAFAVWRSRHLPGVLRRALPHDDARVEALCARRAHELGLRRSPRLAVSDEVSSPQVVGLWRPTILLPSDDTLSPDELDMALMHELAHVRRGDLYLGWIPAAARTLFFFHPAAWLANREYALCREAACDAMVVSRGHREPQNYGRLLLRLGVSPHPHHALPGASPTFLNLKRRLVMLGRIHETPPRAITLALVGVVTLAAALPWRVVAASETPTYVSVSVAPPAPPAPPPVPAAPALPAMPAHAMPTPPTPRAPRAPTVSSSSMNIVSVSDDAKNAFIYFGDGISVMSGKASDFSRAEAMRQGNDDFAWYRDGGKAWALRDPGYLKRIHDVYARASKQADVPQKTADRQERLDREQEALNDQMAKLSERQSDLANRNQNPGNPESAIAYAQGHATIAREQAAVGQKMGDLARERADIARELAEQNRQQGRLADSATREVNQILAEAVRNHVAVEAH
ncbi:MAG: Regulatory protein BlaR1 [Luteibacter sp.]|uniref:M56 family metallopeptidase n=1 Tax=Luteibacter sp. TaxID=1886636 RepID=UPI00137D39B6|nr:M56 family metallopeptidase [Luteibacter sp.]KAF1005113.1 MAG: Regulatory protein BlaR1 [Luteibacter sp.]